MSERLQSMDGISNLVVGLASQLDRRSKVREPAQLASTVRNHE